MHRAPPTLIILKCFPTLRQPPREVHAGKTSHYRSSAFNGYQWEFRAPAPGLGDFAIGGRSYIG